MPPMALNIKNSEVERLAAEVAKLTGENKTEAIRRALQERKDRLAFRVVRKDRRGDLLRFLERAVWSRVPRRLMGRRMSRKEEDAILGYGSRGV
jgi:antitoxin VapB